MKYARKENDVIVEIIESDQSLAELLHPDIAKLFEKVADDVVIETTTIVNQLTPIDISNAIDDYVLSKISAPEFDYPNVGELRAWIDDNDFGIEARQLLNWVLECQKIGFDIKRGFLVFDSVDMALNELPIFNILPVKG